MLRSLIVTLELPCADLLFYRRMKKRGGVPSSFMLSPPRSICPGHFPQVTWTRKRRLLQRLVKQASCVGNPHLLRASLTIVHSLILERLFES